MAQGLTARQRSVLLRIGEGIHLHGYPPTFREIGKAENIHSTNGVRSILEALEKKGYIRRLRYRSRAIELTPRGKEVILESHIGERTGERSLSSGHLVELSDMVMPTSSVVEIPVIGRVAAGQPILAEENIEGHIAIDADFAPGGETFALRVKGRSMVDAGIHDGDVVFCRVQEDAEPGDVVVALIGDDATVKVYRPEKDRVVLESRSPYHGPIVVERGTPDFRILGKVVGLFRRY